MLFKNNLLNIDSKIDRQLLILYRSPNDSKLNNGGRGEIEAGMRSPQVMARPFNSRIIPSKPFVGRFTKLYRHPR